MMGPDSYYHLEQLQGQLDDQERGLAGMERQMDRDQARINQLMQETKELKIENLALTAQVVDLRRRTGCQIPYVAGPGETVPAEFTGSGPMFPGQIGYRAGEHGRPQAPCFECVTSDEDPAPWCDCNPGEICKGPCRRKAHAWNFHEQGCTHYERVLAARSDETCCPYCGVPVSGEGS